MADGRIDRRVVRTREALHRAFMKLVLERPYEAISVTDICEAADVGRATFYAHYKDKDALRRGGLEHLRRALIERQRQSLAETEGEKRPLGFSLTMFEHARDHLALYRAVAGGRAGAIGLATIRTILADLVRAEYISPAGRDVDVCASRELAVEFVVGGYMAMLTWWLDRGAKLPPARLDAVFRRWVRHGMAELSPVARTAGALP